jgi:hypothetical protein
MTGLLPATLTVVTNALGVCFLFSTTGDTLVQSPQVYYFLGRYRLVVGEDVQKPRQVSECAAVNLEHPPSPMLGVVAPGSILCTTSEPVCSESATTCSLGPLLGQEC